MKAFTFNRAPFVISITAILATIGGMNLISHRREKDVNFTIQEIITVLRNAQDRSIAQEEGSRWGVYFNNPSGDGNDFTNYSKG